MAFDDFSSTLESGAFPLRGDELRNWLRTTGSGIFTAFGSGAEALDFLREQGVAIRTQDFYNIRNLVLSTINQISDLQPSLATLEDLYPDSLIPLGDTLSKSYYDLSDNFLYRFHIEAINPQTGEVLDQFIAVSSNYQLTFNEARDLAGSYFTGEYITEGFNVTDFALQAAFMREGI